MKVNEKTEKIISVKGLTKKFGEFTAVDNISFDVKKGEIFAFLGPNGAGKTTTIKMLTTLLESNSGEIMVSGKKISDKDGVRSTFGIVFQDQSLDDELTTYENMEFHGVFYGVKQPERAIRIESMLKLVDLWERKNDFVKTFSGGMKRRLEIARALIHEPKILYLDEPTVGLDPQTRNYIWKYVNDLSKLKGMTIFFTTHYMDEAEKILEKVAVIDHGKIITIGSVKEILASTKTKTLEDAFLTLTGRGIREEEANASSRMRMARKAWKK